MVKCYGACESRNRGFRPFPQTCISPVSQFWGRRSLVPYLQTTSTPKASRINVSHSFLHFFSEILTIVCGKFWQLHSRTMSRGIKEFEKGFAEGVTCKDDCCEEEVHETPDGYLMPLEFLQAIAAGHPNNVTYISFLLFIIFHLFLLFFLFLVILLFEQHVCMAALAPAHYC